MVGFKEGAVGHLGWLLGGCQMGNAVKSGKDALDMPSCSRVVVRAYRSKRMMVEG